MEMGSKPECVPRTFSRISGISIGGVVVTEINFWTLTVSLAVMLILFLFFRFTKLGTAMKAVQQNPFAAKAMGIPTRRILTFTWGLSSMTGGIAWMLIAPIATLDPNMMLDPMLEGFCRWGPWRTDKLAGRRGGGIFAWYNRKLCSAGKSR